MADFPTNIDTGKHSRYKKNELSLGSMADQMMSIGSDLHQFSEAEIENAKVTFSRVRRGMEMSVEKAQEIYAMLGFTNGEQFDTGGDSIP